MTDNEIRTINGKEIVLYREIETDLYRFSKDAVDMLLEALEEREQYKTIGTIDEFKALKEKATPKEPIIIDNRLDEVEWKCPVCGLNVIEEPPYQEYCQRCGNKLDWSE